MLRRRRSSGRWRKGSAPEDCLMEWHRHSFSLEVLFDVAHQRKIDITTFRKRLHSITSSVCISQFICRSTSRLSTRSLVPPLASIHHNDIKFRCEALSHNISRPLYLNPNHKHFQNVGQRQFVRSPANQPTSEPANQPAG